MQSRNYKIAAALIAGLMFLVGFGIGIELYSTTAGEQGDTEKIYP